MNATYKTLSAALFDALFVTVVAVSSFCVLVGNVVVTIVA